MYPAGQIGGGESHLLSLVQNLNRSEFEPIVLSFTDGPMIGKLREMDVNAQIIHTENHLTLVNGDRLSNL